MASQFALRCDGSGIETVARQFAVISWRDYLGISRKQRLQVKRMASEIDRFARRLYKTHMGNSKSRSIFCHKQICFCLFLFAAISAIQALASEVPVPTDRTLSVTIPDGWELRKGFNSPILVALVEKGTGDSFGLLGFKQPDAKFVLNRNAAEEAILKELGSTGKILRRTDTKLIGVTACCVIAETQVEGQKISIARIMAETPLNGFVYSVQYSKLGGGDIDDATIQAVANRLKTKAIK